jgi:integrase
MTLYELIDHAYQSETVTGKPLLNSTRRAPMRTAVKRYAQWLGIDAATAIPEQYHKPAHEIQQLINSHAPTTLSPNTIRNLKSDVTSLLTMAVEYGWLEPLPAPLLSWRERKPYPGSWVRRGEGRQSQPYRLNFQECPKALQDELTAYLGWCEAPLARNRDRRVAKRPVTSRKTYGTMLRLAGFAANVLHHPVASLTLAGLCQPDLIEAYINWWFTRRGKMTAGLEQYLLIPKTIARHWLKDPELADTLTQMLRTLPPKEAVIDKEKRWLSLAQLEEVGLSLYPLNARRLQDYRFLKEPAYAHRHSKRWTALYVAFSLIIRLLIRLPMRQRCIREMLLGKNLFQDNAGIWQIRFVGTELKVAMRRGQTNRYEFPFPSDLVTLLEEWLKDWRPKLAAPGEDHVFLNARGKRLTQGKHVSDMIARATYRFTGVGVTSHIIRDIWATEYLGKFPGDIAGAARRLGNTEAMVLAHYAHIIKRDVDSRAEAFLQGTFAPEKGTSRERLR